MEPSNDGCPPHYWICTEVRIDGVSYTRMECKKCQTRKSIEKPSLHKAPRPWKIKATKDSQAAAES